MLREGQNLAKLFKEIELPNCFLEAPFGREGTMWGGSSLFGSRYCSCCGAFDHVEQGCPLRSGITGFTDESAKWGCSACTFLNRPNFTNCEMCRTPRVYTQPNDSLTLASSIMTDSEETQTAALERETLVVV